MKRKIALSMFCLVFLVGCVVYQSSFVKTSFKALEVSKMSYDSARTIANDLYKQGQITPDENERITEVAGQFRMAHNAAVEALAKYQETKGVSEQEAAEKQVMLASEALAALLGLMKPYLLKMEE